MTCANPAICGRGLVGFYTLFVDGFVKSRFGRICVIPAKAGIQDYRSLLDSGFRRSDMVQGFLRDH
jgi:hypothetical protein